MARKKASALKEHLAPAKLGKAARGFLASLEAMPVPEGTEEAYGRYLDAAHDLEEEWARNDAIFRKVDKPDPKPEDREEFDKSLARIDTLSSRAFGAMDKWRHQVRHVNDKKYAPEADVRATIIDSLADKLDEIEFNLNGGLLASKVAQAIREDVTEGMPSEAPFCDNCE